MLSLLRLLQDEDEIVPPFGTFMQSVPHWGFIIIHSTLICVAAWLSRKTKAAGYGAAANGFLFFILAELSYIMYHAGLTHFLFAHTIAEVLDIGALFTIAMGLRARSPGT
ncbi:MAG TPA: hypothetical protein VKC15_15865 [Gemmatimonadales bacterium]|nr:hypothetical protein [Gemmatimonadales bacterium]